MTTRVDTEYINKMTEQQLRAELINELEQKYALIDAFLALPEVADVPALMLLDSCSSWPRDSARGKEMQRKHGLSAIPPVSECECGAGLWALIRDALMNADAPLPPPPASQER